MSRFFFNALSGAANPGQRRRVLYAANRCQTISDADYNMLVDYFRHMEVAE